MGNRLLPLLAGLTASIAALTIGSAPGAQAQVPEPAAPATSINDVLLAYSAYLDTAAQRDPLVLLGAGAGGAGAAAGGSLALGAGSAAVGSSAVAIPVAVFGSRFIAGFVRELGGTSSAEWGGSVGPLPQTDPSRPPVYEFHGDAPTVLGSLGSLVLGTGSTVGAGSLGSVAAGAAVVPAGLVASVAAGQASADPAVRDAANAVVTTAASLTR